MNEFSALIKDHNLVDFVQNKSYEHNIFYADDKYFLNGDFRFFAAKLEPLELIRQLLEDPIKFLNHIDAEYSFCLFLKNDNKLFLARDKMGMRNIYYFIEDDTIAISSNVFNLLAKKKHRKFSSNGVTQYLLFEFIKDPYTLFDDVWGVERGQLVEIDINKNIKAEKSLFRKRLYEIKEANFSDENKISTQLRNHITRAHEKRMSKNNCVLLSGGIDSTVMAIALKNDLNDSNLHALTFDTIGAEQSEVEYAEFVAKKLNLDHQVVKVDPYKDIDLFNLVDRANFPYIGSIMLSTSMEKIGSHIPFNFFAGQDTRLHTPALHELDIFYLKYLKSPALNKIIQAISPLYKGLIGNNTKVKRKLYSRLNSLGDRKTYILENLFHYHPNSILLEGGNRCSENNFLALKNELNIPGTGLRTLYNSIVEMAWSWQYDDDIAYMSNNIEHYGFNSSMPFYDIELSEFAASLPMDLALKRTKGMSGYGYKSKRVNKYLLRVAYQNDLPEEIIYRDKAVAVTNHIYLNTVMKSYISDLFQEPKIRTTQVYEELNLSRLIELALKNNGNWKLEDYMSVVEIQNLLFIEIIARKYDITN